MPETGLSQDEQAELERLEASVGLWSVRDTRFNAQESARIAANRASDLLNKIAFLEVATSMIYKNPSLAFEWLDTVIAVGTDTATRNNVATHVQRFVDRLKLDHLRSRAHIAAYAESRAS